MYSRADLSRSVAIVVALFLTAVWTNAVAREFRAADTQSEDYPTVPAVNVLAMPFLFRSIEHLQRVLDGPIGNEILDSFESHGFVGLAFYDSGARSIYNSVRPVRSIADMKGLRLRVQQSELMSNMIKTLGAEPGNAIPQPRD